MAAEHKERGEGARVCTVGVLVPGKGWPAVRLLRSTAASRRRGVLLPGLLCAAFSNQTFNKECANLAA